MSPPSKQQGLLERIPFYLLLLLLLVVPLVFTSAIENGFELTKASALKMLGGLFVLASLLAMIRRKNIDGQYAVGFYFDKNFDRYITFFVLAAILSTLFSVKPYISFWGDYDRQIGLIIYLYLFFIYFFSSTILNTSERITICIKAIVAAGIIVSAYAITQALKLDPFAVPLNNNRTSSTLSSSIFAGGFLCLVYPFSISEAIKNRKKYIYSLPVIIIACAIVLTQSRGAYVAFIIETVIMIVCFPRVIDNNSFKFKKRLRYVLLLLVLIIIAFAITVALVHENPFINRLLSITEITRSARWLLWRDSLNAFLLHPLTGSGISSFSNVFENVITFELRKFEVNRYYDNSHSNYLQILCTMGALGAITYLLIIFQSVRLSLKGFLNKLIENNYRFIFLALFAAITGYVIFGIADFDDITIMFYLFVILSLLRSSYLQSSPAKEGIKSRSNKLINQAALIASGCFIIFSFYASYRSVNELAADSWYQKGKSFFVAGDFNESIKAMNSAVTLNFGCAEYKFILANYVYSFCANNTSMDPKTKTGILQQAAQELERARGNIKSDLQYKSLMAMILLEEGNVEQGRQLIDEVLAKDSLSLPLRNNLARYYLYGGAYDKMFAELEFINKYDPFSIDLQKTYLIYYMKINDNQKALACCELILQREPNNNLIRKLFGELKNGPKKPG